MADKQGQQLTEQTTIADDDNLIVVGAAGTTTDANRITKENAFAGYATDADLSGKADKINVLELDNTTSFTPDADYEPATKKYVDDSTPTLGTDDITNDSTTVAGATATDAIDALASKDTTQDTAIGLNTNHRGLTDNPHTVTKTQVGLGNAENTSDADKPVSTATQTALNLKADKSNVLELDNTTSFTPDADYEPATKKYVDDNGGGGSGTGLEKITEGSNTGWRLTGKDPDHYGDIGENAVDLSESNSNNTTRGATNSDSFASGNNTTASGEGSHAEGAETLATGRYSHAEGALTTASGDFSHSENHSTRATGDYSHAEGSSSTASGVYSHAEGQFTNAINAGSHSAGKWNVGTSTDTIHETGIGSDSSNKKNAFEIYTDGTLTAPEATNTLIDARGDQALATKKYVDENGGSGGANVWIMNEVPTEIPNGTITNFSTANTFTTGKTTVIVNRTVLKLDEDYTEDADNKGITLTTAPATGADIWFDYLRTDLVSIGDSGAVYAETLTGDGTTTAFDTANTFIANTIKVYLNGQLLTKDDDYIETDTDTITFTTAPESTDVIRVYYDRYLPSTGNASQLDGVTLSEIKLGWYDLIGTIPTYTSTTDGVDTISFAGEDLTSITQKGDWIRISSTAGNDLVYKVKSVTFSTNTTMEIVGETSVSGTITAVSFSKEHSPQGAIAWENKLSTAVSLNTDYAVSSTTVFVIPFNYVDFGSDNWDSVNYAFECNVSGRYVFDIVVRTHDSNYSMHLALPSIKSNTTTKIGNGSATFSSNVGDITSCCSISVYAVRGTTITIEQYVYATNYAGIALYGGSQSGTVRFSSKFIGI